MSQSLYSCLNPCTFHVGDVRSISTNLHKVNHVWGEPINCYTIGGKWHSRKVVKWFQIFSVFSLYLPNHNFISMSQRSKVSSTVQLKCDFNCSNVGLNVAGRHYKRDMVSASRFLCMWENNVHSEVLTSWPCWYKSQVIFYNIAWRIFNGALWVAYIIIIICDAANYSYRI